MVGCVVITDEFLIGLTIVTAEVLALSDAAFVGVGVGVRVMVGVILAAVVGVGVAPSAPVMVMVEGTELVNAFVLPSLSAPTKVSEENRTATGS